MSERVLSALEVYLDNPAVCPHGHPIPLADLSIMDEEGVPLSDVLPGSSATVISVPEDDEDMLAYMGRIAMRPGGSVTVEETAPFSGPLLVNVGGSRFPVDRDIARRIFVKPNA